MKKFSRILMGLVLMISLNSCYSLSYTVGDGAQKGVEMKEKNNYFIGGLAKGKTSDPTKMAGDANDYSVKIEHSFVDLVINAVTLGIYTPTTTTVTK